MSVTRQKN